MRDPGRIRDLDEPLTCDECEREIKFCEAMCVTYTRQRECRATDRYSYFWPDVIRFAIPGTYCPGCTDTVHSRYQDIVDLEVY